MAVFGWLALCLLGLIHFGSSAALDCAFEASLCNWNNDLTDGSIVWTRFQGHTSTSLTGPDGDHTTGTGYYLYLEASGHAPGDYASLLSPQLPGGGCLEFYYHMDGANIGRLDVFAESSSTGKALVWERNGTQGPYWEHAIVYVPVSSDGLQLRINAVRGDGGSRGDIAIDDIKYYTDPAMCGADDPVNLDCTFEVSLCHWHDAHTPNSLTWTRFQGHTSSSLTGPDGDHTTGSGYYVYMEASGATAGQSASLVSTVFPGSGCLEFYYNMYGDHIGELNVYVDSLAGETLLWTMTGEQGTTWQKATVPIPYSPTGLSIRLTGVRGDGSKGDIAIDDVKYFADSSLCGAPTPIVTQGPPTPAPSLPPTPAPTTQAPTTPAPATVTAAPSTQAQTTAAPTTAGPSTPQPPTVASTSLNCNFDSDFCEWSNADPPSPLLWTRFQGSTSTSLTGPHADHTNGHGHYIYMEASGATPGDTASLYSPYFIGNGCLQFYFHMEGENMGQLDVYAESRTTGETHLYEILGEQGAVWQKAEIFVPYDANDLRIRLTAVRGDGGSRGDIAVDDIMFYPDASQCPDIHYAP